MIYIIVFLLLLYYAVHFDIRGNNLKNKNYWNCYWFALLVLIIIPAIRYRVGGDTLFYMDEFDEVYTDSIKSILSSHPKWQYLWVALNVVLRKISSDFVIFQIFHAIFLNSVVFYIFKKYTSKPFLCVCIYFISCYFFFNFEGLRESIAVCIFLLGLDACIKKKWILYYIYVVIAYYFHDAAFIYAFVPLFVNRFDLTSKRNILILFGLYVLILTTWTTILVNYSFIFSAFADDRAFMYMSNTDLFNFNAYIYDAVAYFITPLFFYYYGKKNGLKTKMDVFASYFFFVIILSTALPGLWRFRSYVRLFAVMYYSELFVFMLKQNYGKLKNGAFFTIVSIMFVCVFYIYPHFRDTSLAVRGTHRYNLYYPYYTIFNPETYPQREVLNYELRYGQ